MGLFDIHIPLLYGEGRKAFYRLQVEILKQNDDGSIFAWTDLRVAPAYSTGFGMLALSPRQFRNAENIIKWEYYDSDRPLITVTNKGLRLEVFTSTWGLHSHKRPQMNPA